LEFDDEFIEGCIDLRKWKRGHRPNGYFALLGELDIDERRGELVIFHGKRHGSAKIGAAEHREPVHAISRDVKPQPRKLAKIRVSRLPDGVPIGLNTLIC